MNNQESDMYLSDFVPTVSYGSIPHKRCAERRTTPDDNSSRVGAFTLESITARSDRERATETERVIEKERWRRGRLYDYDI